MSDFEKRTMGQVIIGFAGIVTWGFILYWDIIATELYPILWAPMSILFWFIYAIVFDNITSKAQSPQSETEIRLESKIAKGMFAFVFVALFVGFLFIPESGIMLTKTRACQILVVSLFLYIFIDNGILLILLRRAKKQETLFPQNRIPSVSDTPPP